jgi:hypothetical protein
MVLVLGLATQAQGQYFPENGREALHQRALDARARLNVLSLSLQPGYEDLDALAFFRLGRGARIVSAYVTNGESGESDVRGEYPNQLAALRRNEAAKALATLGGEEYFLNMPGFGAARDTAVVRSQWDVDSLALLLNKLLKDLRPDVILIARDWAVEGTSPQQEVLRDVLLRVIRKLEPTAVQKKAGGAEEMFQWSVASVWVETGSKAGVPVPVDRIHPLWKKSYREIGIEAGSAYGSQLVQRRQWYGTGKERVGISYEAVAPGRTRKLKSIDDGLPIPVPPLLRGIDTEIASVAGVIVSGPLTSASREGVLRRVSALLDSVDYRLLDPLSLSSQGRKISMQWKLSLESLRAALIGVVVKYSLSPSTVTERQVVHLTIDSIAGAKSGDSVWVYFPFIDQRWYVDETTTKMMPLRLKDPYRLLSPMRKEFDLPAAMDGLSQTTVGKTLTFFVMCKAKQRERNFVYRGSVRMLFAPRFTTEVLTPIVRAVPGERVIVRTTNHSRDGVRDSVHVDDTLATAAKKEFRINVKDMSEVDTLIMQWTLPPREGTFVVPVNISIKMVARFAVRQFETRVDTSLRVALITGLEDSPTAEALRRMGVGWLEISNARSVAERLGGFRVAIVDRRAMTLIEDLKSQQQTFKRFVEGGGHLIVMAQDAKAWNADPLVEGLHLAASEALEEAAGLETDSLHRALMTPNRIRPEDWAGWLFRRAHNIVSGPALANAVVPAKSQMEQSPFIAEWKMGSGTLTYVDLALQAQFLNVHPGSYRLFANLISY